MVRWDEPTSVNLNESGGVVLILDWADIAAAYGLWAAQDVADYFWNNLFVPLHQGGRRLLELPIHFIGHSRGCSLNSRLVFLLAQNGVLIG